MFKVTSLDGVSIQLEHTGLTPYWARLTYTGPDLRFDSRSWPNLGFKPVKVVVLPDSCLWSDTWTDAKIQKLQLLCAGSDVVDVEYSPGAFRTGMKSAVVQRNPTALLVLAWKGEQIPRERNGPPYLEYLESSYDLYRLVILDLREDDESADATTISMFKILIPTYAEAMPQHDKGIMARATRLLSRPRDRAFGQWLIDFSTRPPDVHTSLSYHGRFPLYQGYFQEGRILLVRSRDKTMKKFRKVVSRKVLLKRLQT